MSVYIEKLEPLDARFYPGYTLSNLGYVINRKTKKVLFPSIPAGQVRLVDQMGHSEFVKVRPLVGKVFMGLAGDIHLWPMDGNVANNAEYNLCPLQKRSHVQKSFKVMQEMIEEGETDERYIALKSRMPEAFVARVLMQRELGMYRGFDISDSQPLGYRWVDDRIALIEEHGADKRIEFRLKPYAIADHWMNKESIDEILTVKPSEM